MFYKCKFSDKFSGKVQGFLVELGEKRCFSWAYDSWKFLKQIFTHRKFTFLQMR